MVLETTALSQVWNGFAVSGKIMNVKADLYVFRFLFFVMLLPSIILPLLLLPPYRRSSDSGSLCRLFSPLQTTAIHAFIFIARRFQLFLPSSTHIELRLPTLLSAVDSSFFFFANKLKSPTNDACEIRSPEPSVIIVAFDGNRDHRGDRR